MSRASKIKEWIDNSYSTVPTERMQQLRMCVAIHSYIYYQLNDNLVSDHNWQAWADELTVLQAAYPEYTDAYDKYFVDWDGTTGFHLCEIPGLHDIATGLLRYDHEKDKD